MGMNESQIQIEKVSGINPEFSIHKDYRLKNREDSL